MKNPKLARCTDNHAEINIIESVLNEKSIEFSKIERTNIMFGGLPSCEYYVELKDYDRAVYELKKIELGDLADINKEYSDSELEDLHETKIQIMENQINEIHEKTFFSLLRSMKHYFVLGILLLFFFISDYFGLMKEFEFSVGRYQLRKILYLVISVVVSFVIYKIEKKYFNIKNESD